MSAEPLRVIEGGGGPRGWEALWVRDCWRQSEVPNGELSSTHGGDRRINFARLQQPWLKEAAKRWARARLLAGTSVRSVAEYVGDLFAFSEWLAAQRPEVTGPQAISRVVVEDYLLFIRTSSLKDATRARWLGSLRMLLAEQRYDGLAGLPVAAVIHGAEVPRGDWRLPKDLGAEVFGQVVDPRNLARLRNESERSIILLLAYTGLRVSSVITLPRDALSYGADRQPYLRYVNVKLKREALLPIPPVLEEQLGRQSEWLAEHLPLTVYLLPSPTLAWRAGRDRHVSARTVGHLVDRYVKLAEIRAADGRLAVLHPHLFRHHVGTSMVNEGIPITVVAKVLDHESLDMTARYARVHDETLRREVTRWHERVNIRGERIALPTDGPLEEAAWMKERIARAKQALPNGYCGLPLLQSCPHPNACLSCASFLTDGSFRTVHEQQRSETRILLAKARKNNNMRLVDVLERDEQSLSRILEGLDAIEADDAGEELDLRDLAAPGEPEGA